MRKALKNEVQETPDADVQILKTGENQDQGPTQVKLEQVLT